ncbi:MAG: ROK family transcriptional regulator [Tabrizicola sp.]|nr:ROK family transcriptional regulator [Tabrizicola sp.]
MRDHNERLVLSLVRRHTALAKSDIARMTGLSAQTVSVIMRQLEQDGLLARGEPVRGRVGQPSVPMSLSADGAFFYGLKVGRRSADLVLTDFLGRIRAARRRVYRYPTPDDVVGFVAEAAPELRDSLDPPLRGRIMGMGVAMPFQLWNWVSIIGAPQTEMDAWRARDIGAELGGRLGLPVYIQNDATSACGAELIFGTGERPKDFLYFYFGTFIGGGLVMNGQLFLGRTGNAAAVGTMQVPAPGGGTRRLIDLASMSILAAAMDAAGEPSDHLWSQHARWTVSDDVLSRWLDQAAGALAHATLAAAALVEIQAVLIDGWMPVTIRAELVRRTEAAFLRLDLAGIDPPAIREGTVGADARALGAAAIPLSQRYLIDQNAAIREG